MPRPVRPAAAPSACRADSHHTWTDTLSVSGSRPISSHRARIVGNAWRTSCGVMPSRLSSSAYFAASLQVTFGPLPPTMIGIRGCCTGAGLIDGVLDAAVLAIERCMVLAHHPARDLELILENAEALRGVRKAITVGKPLVSLPTGAEAQLRAPATDRIEGRNHLRRECRIAVGRAQGPRARAGHAWSPRPVRRAT